MIGGSGVPTGEGEGEGVGVGVGVGAAGAITSRVMLSTGADRLKLAPLKLRSLSRVMELADVNCHTWATPAAEKFARFTAASEAVVKLLLITITVKAPSLDRCAANDDRVSGSGTESETLTSPNVDFAPS